LPLPLEAVKIQSVRLSSIVCLSRNFGQIRPQLFELSRAYTSKQTNKRANSNGNKIFCVVEGNNFNIQ